MIRYVHCFARNHLRVWGIRCNKFILLYSFKQLQIKLILYTEKRNAALGSFISYYFIIKRNKLGFTVVGSSFNAISCSIFSQMGRQHPRPNLSTAENSDRERRRCPKCSPISFFRVYLQFTVPFYCRYSIPSTLYATKQWTDLNRFLNNDALNAS